MKRRQYLATVASLLPLAGCTGGPGDPITMLVVNQDDGTHTVTVWAVQREKLAVANTVEVATEGTAQLGQMPWKSGQYRITVQMDGDVVFAREFRSEEWFNQLDVFIDSDGAVELNRGRAA
ncbi:hypothetical protein [Halobellus litoreus]|uniref:Ig-like domain-containing protein n=1 Tax=Halobellus litoreus TaxID=755310 RepID=A0ABD6E034_9EURY|nr:hypothetical protein [Halobellus litoreus]